MFSYWAYILIGNNDTGKTTFQRSLVSHLCDKRYTRLPRNVVMEITHPRAPKRLATLFTCNRSFQEKLGEYMSVAHYFANFFQDADICILSSHSYDDSANQIAEMIQQLKRRCYNVGGVFWSNDYGSEAKEIALLNWDEIFWIDNPILIDKDRIHNQLDQIARDFSELLIARAHIQ